MTMLSSSGPANMAGKRVKMSKCMGVVVALVVGADLMNSLPTIPGKPPE
jgi:hypothetical protein